MYCVVEFEMLPVGMSLNSPAGAIWPGNRSVFQTEQADLFSTTSIQFLNVICSKNSTSRVILSSHLHHLIFAHPFDVVIAFQFHANQKCIL